MKKKEWKNTNRHKHSGVISRILECFQTQCCQIEHLQHLQHQQPLLPLRRHSSILLFRMLKWRRTN